MDPLRAEFWKFYQQIWQILEMKELRIKYMIYYFSLFLLFSCTINKQLPMNKKKLLLAEQLTQLGYSKLFQLGEHSLADSIWEDGKNYQNLLEIVSKNDYDDYARLLASEILFLKQKDYPTKDLEYILAYIYTKALFITGDNAKSFRLSGNLWGFMYHTDKLGFNDNGILGNHLLNTKKKALPYLLKLLDDTEIIFYEGSQEATLGNSLKYRVKDAVAYFIGKIMKISVQFYENPVDRDKEIEKLKLQLK
jgi:hypothetical protein